MSVTTAAVKTKCLICRVRMRHVNIPGSPLFEADDDGKSTIEIPFTASASIFLLELRINNSIKRQALESSFV